MYSHAASRRNLYIVYANVILYATCYQLQRPIEPFMVERLGTMDGLANINDEYARLQSFFSIFQMIGSLFVGVLMEKIGSKGREALCFYCLRHIFIHTVPRNRWLYSQFCGICNFLRPSCKRNFAAVAVCF